MSLLLLFGAGVTNPPSEPGLYYGAILTDPHYGAVPVEHVYYGSVLVWSRGTPALPVAGAALWFDASDVASIVQTAGAVSQWNDKSGNGHNVTQGNAAAQPTTGSVTVNGRNVIDFDGGDFMAGMASLANAAGTFFVVFREDVTQHYSGALVLHTGAGDDGAAGITMNTGSGTQYLGSDRVGNDVAAIAGTGETPLAVWVARYGTPNMRLYQNGGNLSSATTPTTGTTTEILVGGRLVAGAVNAAMRLNGVVAEIVAYPSELSPADTNAVGNYLATKWGLTWTDI